ncbi:Brassinosteroid insensitive 1-associated receptor kinase 1 precursor [Hibiscus syriacus]|uniref:non-specific serine/threonine protein kinase n=1 Tax=Hibiscus syriacus TaxID=106335 RepID=A0A6A2YY59_HIBSY|nr:Brassinosteroid insensitive 1-associated receptor kinase 1 precursor [Hibiscus syriacus]
MPPGFSLLDENNQYAGCKQNYANYPVDCNPDGSSIDEDLFKFKPMSFADFPLSDYGVLRPATELECKQSCLLDCSCAVAILQDPTLSKDGSGTCWKKKFHSQMGGLTGMLLIEQLYLRKLQVLNCVRSRRDLETNLRFFTYKDLEHATNRFKEELGLGAFGMVYKGESPLSYGDHVAVKKLDKFAQDGEREFKTEVKVIGQTHHKNLVRLIGYCDEAEHRLLVYEFMENSSLSSFLFGVVRPSWQQRLQIASGIAKGLTYFHEECSKQIIHCDIKPQNILLDESFTAKISDFGLAKLLMNNKTRTQTGIRGTKGYVAPEWFRNTPVSVKVDVYSFGVMLFEIICCKRCVEVEMDEAAILTEWAFQCYSEGMILKLVENDEEDTNDVGKLETLLKVAIWCVQEEPMLRPSMRTVTMMLEGAVHVPSPPCPFLLNTMSMSTTMI